jgi:hypothetical protein
MECYRYDEQRSSLHAETLKQIYHMLNYITRGQVETLLLKNRETALYLPLEAVKKEKREKSKGVIVFDGSSHEKNAHSVNDV